MSVSNTTSKSQAAIASTATPKTAKLFKNGRSQAVRLPKEFRFEGDEVTIRRDPATGELVLSSNAESQKASWEDRFAVWDASGSPSEDAMERDTTPPVERDFF